MPTVLKIVFLFLIAWQGPVIIARLCAKNGVGAESFYLLAAGITVFVYLQFLM